LSEWEAAPLGQINNGKSDEQSCYPLLGVNGFIGLPVGRDVFSSAGKTVSTANARQSRKTRATWTAENRIYLASNVG